MKSFALLAVSMANVASAAIHQESLSELVADIPSCAFNAFAKGMSSEGCNTSKVDASDFDCLCKHTGAIIVTIERVVEVTCISDFAQAVGSLCGIWEISGTDAPDLASATKLLASELAGNAVSATSSAPDSSPTGSSGSGSESASSSKGSGSEATAAGSSKSSNLAAAPTLGREVVGMVVGGAAALVGFMV